MYCCIYAFYDCYCDGDYDDDGGGGDVCAYDVVEMMRLRWRLRIHENAIELWASGFGFLFAMVAVFGLKKFCLDDH